MKEDSVTCERKNKTVHSKSTMSPEPGHKGDHLQLHLQKHHCKKNSIP